MTTRVEAAPRDARVVKGTAWLLGVLYAVCLAVVALAGFVLVNTAEDSCAFYEDGWGRTGTASWSWFPIGQTCTYELEQVGADGAPERFVHVDPPSPMTTVALVLVVVAPAGAVVGHALGLRRAADR